MGRIRTIKPEFFMHEGLFDLEAETGLPIRVAFAGLWCQCDREGRFNWRPRTLKAQILPYDDCDFSRVLDALATRGFIQKYACHGAEFGCVPSFSTHQVVNNREAYSQIPSPDASGCEVMTSTRAPRVPHACPTESQSCAGERKGKEGKGTGREQEGKGKDICTEPEEPAAVPEPADLPPFPCVGGAGQWMMPQDLLDSLSETFAALDVRGEITKARAWLECNPTRRKTSRGMAKFLFGWLERCQNGRGGARAGPVNGDGSYRGVDIGAAFPD